MVKKRIDSYVLILKILTRKKIKFFLILFLSAISAITSGLSIGLIIQFWEEMIGKCLKTLSSSS